MSLDLITLLCSVCGCPCRRFQREVGLFGLVAYMTKEAETLSEMLRFKGIERWTLSKTCQLQQYFR